MRYVSLVIHFILKNGTLLPAVQLSAPLKKWEAD